MWCSAALQMSLKHALFACGLCCVVDPPMHLTVTDMCQTVSKLIVYMRLCTVSENEREQRLGRGGTRGLQIRLSVSTLEEYIQRSAASDWLESRTADANAGLPIVSSHESPCRLPQYRERDGRRPRVAVHK